MACSKVLSLQRVLKDLDTGLVGAVSSVIRTQCQGANTVHRKGTDGAGTGERFFRQEPTSQAKQAIYAATLPIGVNVQGNCLAWVQFLPLCLQNISVSKKARENSDGIFLSGTRSTQAIRS